MASIIAILWSLGFTFSVILAPQPRVWFWGPTMILLGIASVLSVLSLRKTEPSYFTFSEIVLGSLLCLWIGGRAIASPVGEFGQAELLLLCLAISTYLSLKVILPSPRAVGLMLSGVSAIFTASLVLVAIQIQNPGYSPIFHLLADAPPTGFYGHYSYGASFFIALSTLFAAISLLSNYAIWLRITSGALALGGFLAVVSSSSRAGLVAACLSFAVLGFLAILLHREKKWFGLAIVVYPLLLVSGGAVSLFILSGVQEGRTGDGSLIGLMDNPIRLHLMSLAVSCITLHPFIGGGSRSFSWESFQFWDPQAMGIAPRIPEHVHNEFIQTITDYGLIGAILLLVFLLFTLTRALVEFWTKEETLPVYKVLSVGGLSGLIGLLTHSNFEGIFRIPPGAILLAFCLASASALTNKPLPPKTWKTVAGKAFCGIAGICAAAFLLFFGIKGSAASIPLWSVYHSKLPISSDEKIDRIGSAIKLWPTHELFLRRGKIHLNHGLEKPQGQGSYEFKTALSDFQEADRLHPFSPYTSLNLGFANQQLGNMDRARSHYEKAVEQQGGMEGAYRAKYHLAQFLSETGASYYAKKDYQTAVDHLMTAVDLLHGTIEEERILWFPPAAALFVPTHQYLGSSLENLGNYQQAFELYERAATTPHGNQFFYYSAVLLHNRGVVIWKNRKPQMAYRFFIEANERLDKLGSLPPGVTEEARNDLRAKLTNVIQLLSSARIKPENNLLWDQK